MGGGTKGEERRRRHCYRKLKRVEFIRSPFLSPRLSFDFSIVALLQRKYYPRLHTWIQQLDRTENLGRGELKFLEPDFECVYIYIYIYEGRCEPRIAVFEESRDGNGWPFHAGKIFSECLNGAIGLFREWYILSYQRAKRFISAPSLATEGTGK